MEAGRWEGSSQRLCCCYLLNICPKTPKQNTTGLHILFNYGIHMIRCQVRIVFKHTIDFIDTRSEMQEVYFIMKTFEKTSKCYRSVAQLICSLQRQYVCSLSSMMVCRPHLLYCWSIRTTAYYHKEINNICEGTD